MTDDACVSLDAQTLARLDRLAEWLECDRAAVLELAVAHLWNQGAMGGDRAVTGGDLAAEIHCERDAMRAAFEQRRAAVAADLRRGARLTRHKLPL